MKKFTAGEIAAAVSGELLQGESETAFTSVSTDTRQIKPGDLFVALIGERFDAHEFIGRSIAGGAGGLIVSRPVALESWPGPVILVKDTLSALQELARHNRRNFAGLVIAVTGSNGKTTTKDMIFSVLDQKYPTLKTEGNFNNEIGLPLTMLQLDDSFGAAVLELGMRGMGEIDLLAGLALPDGAVITNVGETHLERLGSVANIGKAKGEILEHVNPQGFAVLNGDDLLVRQQAKRCRGTVVYYGTDENADIRAANIEITAGKASYSAITPVGNIEIKLPIPGRHNVLNSMAAIGIGLKAGLTLDQIKTGLEQTRLTSMRLEIIETDRATVINDSYNANPASAKAALQILADVGRGKRKVAILGDMYELGSRTAEGHQEVGAAAAESNVDVLITVGNLAVEIALGATLADEPPTEIISLNTNAEVKRYLEKVITPGDVILVKGSRGVKLEEVVEFLVSRG
jgi:UDP-N-acetylmuramoyl-tripeptide--D-alanyl-D-alanine ligase